MNEGDKVILFDGVCKLCNAWVRFVIRHDKHYVFKLASMQSEQGQVILRNYNLPTQGFETLLFIENNIVYEKSTAFLKIVRLFPFPARLLTCLYIFPKTARDFIYDRIARNRYKLFGKREQCLLPNKEDVDRFL